MSQEALATRLTEELQVAVAAKNVKDQIRIVTRVLEELSWTEDLDKKLGLCNDVQYLRLHFPGEDAPDEVLISLAERTVHKLLKDKVDDTLNGVHERWWRDPPLPPDRSDVTTVLFEDITAQRKPFGQDDIWQVEHVPAILDEPFDNLFLRFRTQANKRHRHPYRPALSFDAVLSDSCLICISTSGDIAVRDVIRRLESQEPPKVPYIRNDDDRSAQIEQQRLPIWAILPWDRTLPSWFPPPPSHWLNVIPPPAYGQIPSPPRDSVVENYNRVPVLIFPGNGRNILPSITQPSLVATQVYLMVGIAAHDSIYSFTPDPECDHVLPERRFSPPLSIDQAKSLLGRPIQFSTEPVSLLNDNDGVRAKKRWKKTTKEKEAQEIGYAWGLDPDAMLLHCFRVVNSENRDFVLDLNVRTSKAKLIPFKWDGPPLPPMTIERKYIEWIGVVTLAEDKRVMALHKTIPQIDKEPVSNQEGHDDYHQSLVNVVRGLNVSQGFQLFQLGKDDALLFGDLQLAKGEGMDGLGSVVSNVKPGVWAIRVEPTADSRSILHLSWVKDGPLELPITAPLVHDFSSPASATDWELLTTFSADAGIVGILARSAFADDGPLSSDEMDVESILETLTDFMLFGETEDWGINNTSFYLAVPGGVICSVDDGGYEVMGQRNESHILKSIKVMF